MTPGTSGRVCSSQAAQASCKKCIQASFTGSGYRRGGNALLLLFERGMEASMLCTNLLFNVSVISKTQLFSHSYGLKLKLWAGILKDKILSNIHFTYNI